MGPQAADAIPTLAAMLGDADIDTAQRLMGVLAAIGPQAKPAVANLRLLLHHKDLETRAFAAYTLMKIGDSCPEIVAALANILERAKYDSPSFNTAFDCLRELGLPHAVPSLIRLLKHKNACARWTAAQALGSLGAEESIPHLIRLLSDKDSAVRLNTIYALKQFGEKARAALPALTKLARRGSMDDAAKAALERIQGEKE